MHLLILTWQVTLPDEKQLRLSEDAVLHMRRILDEFSYVCDDGISLGSTRQRLHQLLAEFFDTFGSHVFRRPANVAAYVGKTTAFPPGRTRSHCDAEGCSTRTVSERHQVAEFATSLNNRRAHQVRWPLPCARRDGKQHGNVGSYCARRSQHGDLEERIQQEQKRLLRQGESSTTSLSPTYELLPAYLLTKPSP